jgi:hypothetical protein
LTTQRTTGDQAGWSDLCDALLRGIAHALSNRVGALMLFVDADVNPPTPQDLAILPSEVGKLHELNRLLHLLPLDLSAASEALQPSETVADVLALMQLHPNGRDFEWPLRLESAQPVRAARSVLHRTLLLLFESARRAAQASGGKRVHLSIGGNEQKVVIAAQPEPGVAAADVLPEHDLAPLLSALSARVAAHDGSIVLELPTLLELRRRERASRR